MAKTYKTWEMIKELTENPEKKFISKRGSPFEMVAKLKDDCLLIGDKFGAMASLDVNRIWEEVKEPVSFMEAVESGKQIKVEHKLISSPEVLEENDYFRMFKDEYINLSVLLDNIVSYFGAKDIRDIILNGEWYIGD